MTIEFITQTSRVVPGYHLAISHRNGQDEAICSMLRENPVKADKRAVDAVESQIERETFELALKLVPDQELSYWCEENFGYNAWDWDGLLELCERFEK